MELKFEIDEDLLASCALFSKRAKNLEGWVDLKNQLWVKYKDTYDFFNHTDYGFLFLHENYTDTLNKFTKTVPLLLEDVKKSEKFKELLSCTRNYTKWLEDQWLEKKEVVLDELEDILKISLPDVTFTVFVIAPVVGGGRYLGDHKIFWGHDEDWPNYNIVYLMHEVLHELIENGPSSHAVIELATDNELRIRLGGSKKYFAESDTPVGHEYLLSQEKKLLPKWKKYLGDTNTNIYGFISSLE